MNPEPTQLEFSFEKEPDYPLYEWLCGLIRAGAIKPGRYYLRMVKAGTTYFDSTYEKVYHNAGDGEGKSGE